MRKFEVYADTTFLAVRYSLTAAMKAIADFDTRWVGACFNVRVKERGGAA